MGKQIYPEPCVGAFILNSKGEMLLCKLHKWPKYTLEGGHIKLGESIERTLIREIKERIGLNIKPIRLIKVQEAIYSKELSKSKHFILLDFLCELVSGKIRFNENEIQSCIWVKPEKAIKMKIDSFTKETIREYLKTKKR